MVGPPTAASAIDCEKRSETARCVLPIAELVSMCGSTSSSRNLPPWNDAAVRCARPRASEVLPVDRKSVGWGKKVSVSVDLGGRRIIKKKTKHEYRHTTHKTDKIHITETAS